MAVDRVVRLLLFSVAAIIFHAFAATSVSAQASNIYITPDGAGNGICTSNTHPPSWFNNSANWGGGSAQIGAGTIVLLCGSFQGGNRAQFLVFQASGAPGNPIRLVFDNNASISAPYVSDDGAIKTNGASYITIDGGATLSIIQNRTCFIYVDGTGTNYESSCFLQS